MPNHTSCLFKVIGEKSEIEPFIEKARKIFPANISEGEVQRIFTLQSFLAPPKEILEVSSPVKIVSQEEYDAAVKKRDEQMALPEEKRVFPYNFGEASLPLTAALSAEYKEKFGADNWYDWNIQNWGTKWDVYEISDAWRVSTTEKGEKIYQCNFQTAWSPPTQAIVQISVQYPNLTFYLAYADEGGGFLGYSIIKNGNIIDNPLPHEDWFGKKQKKFRALCGQPSSLIDHEDDEEEETKLLSP